MVSTSNFGKSSIKWFKFMFSDDGGVFDLLYDQSRSNLVFAFLAPILVQAYICITDAVVVSFC